MKSYFLKENLGRMIVTFFGIFIIIITLAITFFLFGKGMATFTNHNHNIFQFLFGSDWEPSSQYGQKSGTIGSAIFIVGSITISSLALLIATPFSVATSIFIAEISTKFGKKVLQPVIEIFVGIPSVVYGWVGVTVLCPFIATTFHLPFGGESVLAGAIVLSVMIFPTIASVSTDAIRAVPHDYKEASYALGSTRWQMISRIVIPSALPGILTGVVLGLSRAFGEALAVSMVIGGRIAFPKNIFSQTSTLTTQIASGMGATVDGTEWIDSLWSMALLLFIISFLFILIIRIIGRKGKKVE